MTETTRRIALEARNLSKSYPTPDGELNVLHDINFTIQESESVAIVGVSGSGKSTLLALLAGLEQASAGEIELNGVSLTNEDEDGRARLRNRFVGFVFQQFHLLPNLTALENVSLPLELVGEPDAQRLAKDALVDVGLNERLGHFPRQLSGGEQQRVALARAFCTTPKILFADEPTGNLDRRTADQVSALLFDLNAKNNTTLVLVTHDETLAGRCHRLIRLADGRISSDESAVVAIDAKRA